MGEYNQINWEFFKIKIQFYTFSHVIIEYAKSKLDESCMIVQTKLTILFVKSSHFDTYFQFRLPCAAFDWHLLPSPLDDISDSSAHNLHMIKIDLYHDDDRIRKKTA